MNNSGLLNISIVLKTTHLNWSTFLQDISFLEYSCNGIFMNAFDLQKRKKLNYITDIDLSLDTTYIIEYRIENNNFFIEIFKDYLSISFSKYLEIPLFMPLIPIFQKYALMSNFILVGFEVSLFLDEYPACISTIIDDKSLYPLYVSQLKGILSFKRYSGNRSMEECIEKNLRFIFGDNIRII